MRSGKRRAGMSLLELIMATTLMTMLVASVSVLLHSSRVVWEAHEADWQQLDAAYGTLRHIVRWLRQAEEVVAVSSPSNTSGSITIRMPTGDTYTWRHDAPSRTVNFGAGTASELLAENIESLVFEAFKGDGVTPTTDVNQMQCFRVSVGFRLSRETGSTHIVRSWVMMRAW